MDTMWDEDSGSGSGGGSGGEHKLAREHNQFLRRLWSQRAAMFVKDREYMRSLRFKPEVARHMQKVFGSTWRDYHGTTVYNLIASAHGETWADPEDEEKNAFCVQDKKEVAINKRATRATSAEQHGELVGAREEGSRGGQHKLQGEPQAGEQVVEEGRRWGQQSRKSGSLWERDSAGPEASQEEEVHGL